MKANDIFNLTVEAPKVETYTLLINLLDKLAGHNTQKLLSLEIPIGTNEKKLNGMNQINTETKYETKQEVEVVDLEVSAQIEELCLVPEPNYLEIRNLMEERLKRQLNSSEKQLITVFLKKHHSQDSKHMENMYNNSTTTMTSTTIEILSAITPGSSAMPTSLSTSTSTSTSTISQMLDVAL